jgi:hypothetical protein
LCRCFSWLIDYMNLLSISFDVAKLFVDS